MRQIKTRTLWLVSTAIFAATLSAQQTPTGQPTDTAITLNVVVSAKAHAEIPTLSKQDFTLLDNKSPQPITNFKFVSGASAPIEVLVVIDAVNTSFQSIAYERGEIDAFLKANGGHLEHPTALAVVSDTGTQVEPNFTTDGNALDDAFDKHVIGLRSLNRSAGFYGAAERFQISLTALQSLVARVAPQPGRKIIIWLSPGWPLLTGPRIQETEKEQQGLFSGIVGLSTQLRMANVTVYGIDPLGTLDSGSRIFYYQEFLKGVSKPSQVQPADLSLQVVATQSGGLALNSSNDITAQLQKVLADTDAYYELTFRPPPSEHRGEYHQLEIKLAQPGLTARTRSGYYTQP